MASPSQAHRDLQADKKSTSKQVDSSFRQIPPSTSNPTQNKSMAERSTKWQMPRSLYIY
ncbi:hypothetical protein L1049_012258 [Liquidambar formosana]|uniref:Uncharacterized protein n=1 Tax=Liquidambar formosana TaxID=63359 RepID=A0AAP0RYP8_LIQFO